MNAAERLGVVDADLDDRTIAALWAESGAAWLTDPAIGAPRHLVRRIVGLADSLDRRGAGVGSLVPARGLGLLAERAAAMGLPSAGAISAGGATRFVSAADGWLALSLARDEDRALVPAWLEVDGIDQLDDDGVWPSIERAVRERTVVELTERSALLGLPCGVVDEVGDDAPARAESLGTAEPLALDGALVVDLASLWAGPLCADLLARTGVRLITVESTRRPDGGRLARRFFAALHGRSESVALDLTTTDGRRRLTGLLAAADVVIEGSRPRALAQMGIDARSIATASDGPQIWVSITAHGRSGDAAHRVGFGDDAAASGGLVGWVNGGPCFVADAVADPLTGLTAAHIACELLERGGRWLVDVALARAASSVRPTADGWIELQAREHAERPRPRSDPGAPMPLGRDTASVLAEFGLDEPEPGRASDLG